MLPPRESINAPEWSLAYKLQREQQQMERRVKARKHQPQRSQTGTLPGPGTHSKAKQHHVPKISSRPRTKGGSLQGRLVNSPLTRTDVVQGRLTKYASTFDVSGHLRSNRVELHRQYGVRTDILKYLDWIGGSNYVHSRNASERRTRRRVQKHKHHNEVVALVVDKAEASQSTPPPPSEWMQKKEQIALLKRKKTSDGMLARPSTVDPALDGMLARPSTVDPALSVQEHEHQRSSREEPLMRFKPRPCSQGGLHSTESGWESGVSVSRPYVYPQDISKRVDQYPAIFSPKMEKSRNKNFSRMRRQDCSMYEGQPEV